MTPQAAFPPSAPSPQPHRAPLWRWLLLALVLVVLDQGIKLWIVQNYAWGHSSAITSFFNFVRVHNTGAAFSFLAGHDGWQRWFFVGIAAIASAFLIWQLRSHGQHKLLALALTLILGGAIGNAIDRLAYGYVVDYLDFHWAGRHFPAFNLADMAITAGVIGMLLVEWQRWREERRQQASSAQGAGQGPER